MFDKFQGLMGQLQLLQKLMKDENFKAFMSHPKVQALFQDPEFQNLVKSKDPAKLLSHPKFSVLREDPELVSLISKLKTEDLFGNPPGGTHEA